MTISFPSTPSAIRVPLVTAEFDNSKAEQGPALLAYRALLIGQKAGGAAAPNTLQRVTRADAVAAACGRGCMLHRQALAWFSANKSTELWIGILADAASAAVASGTITVTGPATAAGTIALYLGGERITISVASGDSASTVASAVASAVGKRASGTVTFASAVATDNITIAGTTEGGESVSVTFVGTTGAVNPGDATYSVDTGNSQAAASFVAQILAHPSASKLVRATASSAVATVRAHQGGTAGNSVSLTATSGSHTALSGATLSGGAAGQNLDLAVHATVSSAVVTLRSTNAGAVGNEFDIRHSYLPGEALPAGIGLTIAAMSGGATNPTLTSLIAAMGDSWYQVIAHPYTDSTSLGAIETELSSRFGPMRMIDGVAITAKSDSYSNVATLGNGRNSPHSVILRTNDSPTPPGEYAAATAAVVAAYGAADPARPFQTLPLNWVDAPAEADRDTLTERNLLLFDGISTTRVGGGDLVQIERLITTYKTNPAGSPDTSYLDLNTMLTLQYLRYSFRVRMARYSRHKLASDGNRIGAGQAVMTPSLGRAEAVAWFADMEELGLVEGRDQFKRDLVVERNISDPNRLDFLLPPDLINQLVVTAANIQFLL